MMSRADYFDDAMVWPFDRRGGWLIANPPFVPPSALKKNSARQEALALA